MPAGMSRSTSAMSDRSTQWTQSQQSHYHQQTTNSDTYGLDIKSTVQRVDSYGTSSSSHDPQSAFSIESPFDFNQPTPSDHNNGAEFHVPELDSSFWQNAFVENGVTDLDNFGDTYQGMENIHQTYAPHTAGLATYKNILPSPQLTNTSTPEAMSHSKQPSQSSTYMHTPTSEPSHGMRSLGVNDPVDTINPEHLHTPARSNSYVTSPIIHISSHPRGDSPARSDFEQRRLSRKRSASNLSQSEYYDALPEPSRSGMLNVPHHNHDLAQDEVLEDDYNIRLGLSPTQRGNEEHPSLTEMQQQEDENKNVAEVSGWLEKVSLNPSPRYAKGALLQDRVRSRSTGAQPRISQRPILKVTQTPGPGLVIDERSDYWYSSDGESNLSLEPDDHPVHPRVEDRPAYQTVDIPSDGEDSVAPDADPRAAPWRDPKTVPPPNDGRRYQPATANLAMAKFNARVREFDTLSRRATWGTSTTTLRRLSDGDQDSVLEVGRTRHYSLSKGRSLIGKVKGKIQRTPSRSKKTMAEPDFASELRKVHSPDPMDDTSSADSQPKPSRPPFSRNKSPSISAALGGITGSVAAVGAGPANLNINTSPQPQSEGKFKSWIKRRKSDVGRSPRSPNNLQALLSQGTGLPGPEMIPIAQEEPEPATYTQTPPSTVLAPQLPVPSPITMTLSPRPANVVPNMEGFKVQIKELNLMLDDFLLDRTAYDQLRRYKRLVRNRVEHIQLCAQGRCPSGPLCSALRPEVEHLPPRSRGREATTTQFQMADSDDEETFDGFVTANAFPEGIPMPPTNKLPARFECPLCFQVKSFQKPSDWTKHVHEDVQPFTCTFRDCQDSKPFKRKADWVRHENEKHRHLEWWRCNIGECNHQCHRKDNFAQHLVREHKRKEPKPNRRMNSNIKGKGKSPLNLDQEDQEFWRLVDSCRHEKTSDPRVEACPFCGNTCTSWKKLSVHVGKHMEQIAMPTLDLVSRRNVTKDTPISPLEPQPTNSQSYNMNDMSMDLDLQMSDLSPANTSYPNSSAAHSPFLTYHRVLHPPTLVTSQAGDQPMPYANQMAGRAIDAHYMYHNAASGIIFDGLTGTAQATSFLPYGGQPIYSDPLAFTTSDQTAHSMVSHDGFSQIYETSGPPQFLSSPEQQFSNIRIGRQMLPTQGNMHIQTPVTSHPMTDGTYMPHQQDQWHPQR